jgi:hypothetical protein
LAARELWLRELRFFCRADGLCRLFLRELTNGLLHPFDSFNAKQLERLADYASRQIAQE